jgi:hypothetical protein
MPVGDPFGYMYGPMPPLDPMMGMPEDPYAAAHQYGKGQAGLALLSTAGSRNYASNLAQALGAYTSGRGSQMQQFQELARLQQAQQMREAQLALQAAAQERLTEAEERRMREVKSKEDQAAQERRYYLEQIPEEERPKYALAPLDALKKATEATERKTRTVDLGDREVLIDAETGEEIKSYSQGRIPGEGGRKTYRVDLGSRISVRDSDTHQEVESISKDPSASAGEELSPGGLSAAAWLKVVQEENPAMSALEAAQEAERRAAASRRKVSTGPGVPVDREAAGALGNARVTPAPVQRPVPGASSTPVRTPATTPSAPAAAQIRSALPDGLRDDPRVIAAIQRMLARGQDPETIIDQILATARGDG